MKACKVSGY